MTGKQKYKDQIDAHYENIGHHKDKINNEKKKYVPDNGLIKKWNHEIKVFEGEVKKAEKRLYRKIKSKRKEL